MRIIFCGFVLMVMFTSCEPGILFPEPQPLDADTITEFPESFRGDYLVYDPKTGKEAISAERNFAIKKDSILLLEYRSAEIHKNFVDGASYELRDGYLYRDKKQISIYPAELKGSMYHYISKVDTLAFYFHDENMYIREKDTSIAIPCMIKSSTNYVVVNLYSEHRDSTWMSVVFLKSTEKIEVRIAPDFDKISETVMKTTYRSTPYGERESYLVMPKNKAEFEKLVKGVFIPVMHLKKVP